MLYVASFPSLASSLSLVCLSERVDATSNEAVGFALNHEAKLSSNTSKIRGTSRYRTGPERFNHAPHSNREVRRFSTC